MREAHGERSLAGLSSGPRGCFFFRHEKDEAREVFGVVLDAFRKNGGPIVFSGAASSDGGARFVPAGKGFADASGGVLGGNSLPVRMGGKKTLALCQRHWMRGN